MKGMVDSQPPEEKVAKEGHEGQSNGAGRKRKHHGKDVKESDQTRLVQHRSTVGMIMGNINRKRPYEQEEQWTNNEISFPSVPGCQLVDSPIILEALIEGFQGLKQEQGLGNRERRW
ncbi:hypothetical protein Tco_0071486 [Tanacetum coccineum]